MAEGQGRWHEMKKTQPEKLEIKTLNMICLKGVTTLPVLGCPE